MADKLVIEILDYHGGPRCAIYWRWGGRDAFKYSAALAYAIGSLNDDSSTEKIIENIREVFPEIGVPRTKEFYIDNDLGMDEYALATQYADDLGLPEGNVYDGLLLVSRQAIDAFACGADSLNYLYLGNVTAKDCVVEECIEEYWSLNDYRKGSKEYEGILADIEEVKESAYSMTETFLNKPITTVEDARKLLNIITKYEWIECEGLYYHTTWT